jgi:hypothetical protein
VFADNFPKSAIGGFNRIRNLLLSTERGGQLNKEQRTIIIASTTPTQGTGHGRLNGQDYIFLNPYDSRYLDARSKKGFNAFPNELPPAGDKGKAIILGHEVGHGHDDDEPDGRNVERNENPIRRQLGVHRREHYQGHPVPNPRKSYGNPSLIFNHRCGSPRKIKMKPTILLAVALATTACATASKQSIATLLISPAITKDTALHTAIAAVKKRNLVLPIDYKTEVSESFISQEMGPTIPVFAILFYVGRGEKRIRLYQVAVNRSNGEVHYFFNLLKVTPADL